MKHTLLLIGIFMSALLVMAGCAKDPQTEIEDVPSLTLSLVGEVQTDGFTVGIAPDELTADYEYVLTEESDSKTFEDGTMQGIVKVGNGDDNEVVFDGLTPATRYFVYARAYDEAGSAGPVAVFSVTTTSPETATTGTFEVGIQYVADKAIAFTVTTSMDYYKMEFAIGKSGDKENFENGTLEGIMSFSETFKYTVNYLEGIEPETDYIFFARAYDRFGGETEVKELLVRTLAEGDAAAVTFSITGDVYKQTLTFTPNEHCDQISVFSTYAGTVGGVVTEGYLGDIAAFVEGAFGSYISSGSKPLVFSQTMGELATDIALEAYAVSYKKVEGSSKMQVAGVQVFSFVNCEYDDTLPQPAPIPLEGITISDVTPFGATVSVKVDDPNMMGYMINLVEADWYDDFKNSPEYYENYIRDQIFASGQYFMYKDNFGLHIQDDAQSEFRYYVAICPMNANGVSDPDWGKLTITEESFTTLPFPEDEW